MERSHTQTLYRYLPGSVFNHDDGFIVKVDHITGPRATKINRQVLLEEVAHELELWRPEQIGIPDPRVAGDEYVFIFPEEVSWEIYPLTFECTNQACKRVTRWFNQQQVIEVTEATGRIQCPACHSKMRQLRYLTAHNCGEMQPLQTKSCSACNDPTGYYLDDQGSFASSSWRCRSCGNEVGIRFTPCRACGDRYAAPGKQSFQQGFTARDQRLWYPQTISTINISESQTYDNLQRHPQRGLAALVSWLGDQEDLSVSLADLERPDGGNRLSAEVWEEQERGLRQAGVAEQVIEELLRLQGPATTGVPAMAATVSPAVLAAAESRTMVERAGLFDKKIVSDRVSFAEVAAIATGPAVTWTNHTLNNLRALAIADVSVTQKFPVVVASFGFSRCVREPGKSDLKSYAKHNRYESKTPIFAVPADTEALLVTLDARAVLGFLAHEGEAVPAAGPDERTAKLALYELLAADPAVGGESVAGKTRRLVHSVSHALLRALDDGQSGFGESSLAEWIAPDALTSAIYVASYNEFTLGALDTVLRRRLANWLLKAVDDMEHCDNDPMCSHVSPKRPHASCDRCLHLSFGCRTWNADLDRRLLRRFWLWTQRQALP